MTIKGDAPEWAVELLTQVCKDYHRSLPTVFMWRNRKGSTTTGATWMSYKYMKLKKDGAYKYLRNHGEIRIRAGWKEEDQKLVLLHEAAHHILNKGKRQGHSLEFWKLAFELFQHYGVDMEYAVEREKHYRVKASKALEVMYG